MDVDPSSESDDGVVEVNTEPNPHLGRQCCVCFDAQWFRAIICDYIVEDNSYTVYYYADKTMEDGVPFSRISFELAKAH